MLRAAAAHPGAALIEIYQNCPVFNDGAFDALTEKRTREETVVSLEHGKPIRFGADREHGVVRGADGDLHVAAVASVGEDALLIHDAHREDPSLAFALSRLVEREGGVTPIGIFRQAPRTTATASLAAELSSAQAGFGLKGLSTLLHAADTWAVGA
jgi:2-oxoglutarate ferredoxin oxidoreductase subunit beta